MIDGHPEPSDVFVATPSMSKSIHMDLAQTIQGWTALGVPHVYHKDPNGGYLDVMRARMCETFLRETKAKFFLMIDSDVVPPLNAWYAMAAHDKPVVIAPVPVLRPSGFSWNFVHEDANGTPRFPVAHLMDVPSKGLIRVRMAGSGVIMIRRDVLESFSFDHGAPEMACGSLDVPFFIPESERCESVVKADMEITTDYQFCRQVYEKGFDVWVDLALSCIHHKTQGVKFESQVEGGDDWKLPVACPTMESKWDPWPEVSSAGALAAVGKG